jgi:hypothetical protein
MKLASYESAQSIMKEDLSLWHALHKGPDASQEDKGYWPSTINFTTHSTYGSSYWGQISGVHQQSWDEMLVL